MQLQLSERIKILAITAVGGQPLVKPAQLLGESLEADRR
jgi:hypothetical protein